MSSLTFFLDEQPIPKQRPRFGNGNTFTPKRTQAYEKRIGTQCLSQMNHDGIEPFTGDVSVKMSFYREGARRADIDNLCKAVLDGINGIAFIDDKQVTALWCETIYNAHQPCVIVTVTGKQP